MHDIVEAIRHFMASYGYWSVAISLLLENAGVPVPGETILLIASASAYNQHRLNLPWIIIVGTIAATAGDNLGYWIGRRGGRPLLERWRSFFHIGQRHIAMGEALIEKHGPVAIFLARFLAGARIFAGPIAGILHMEWKRFALFNFLGAMTWVAAISAIGYAFGSQLDRVMHFVREANYLVLAAVTLFIIFLWFRRRRALSQ